MILTSVRVCQLHIRLACPQSSSVHLTNRLVEPGTRVILLAELMLVDFSLQRPNCNLYKAALVKPSTA
jgi:hypothetical protein